MDWPVKTADPARAPSQDSGTKKRAEESGNSVLKAPAHHADSRKNEPAKADDGPSVHGESFEGSHQRLRPGEVHRSLGVSDAASDTRKQERSKRRSHHVKGVAEGLLGEGFSPPFGGEIGRPIESLSQPDCAADSEHLCTSADSVSARRKPKIARLSVSNNKTMFGYSKT